jgi:hypothetical protein
MNRPKNLWLMYRGALKFGLGGMLLFVLMAILTKKFWLAYSAILGFVFGLIILRNWIMSQKKIMDSRQVKSYLFYYFSRLILFAVPLVISLWFKNLFNVYITLLFLLSFQWYLVGFELVRNFSKTRQKKT